MATTSETTEIDAAKMTAFLAHPLIAILRKLDFDDAVPTADILFESGFSALEIPLTSDRALESIENVAKRFGERGLVGGGTALTVQDVIDVSNAGGDLIVSPNVNKDVIEAARARDMICFPGVSTPSEGFAALSHGASGLKIFPAEAISPNVIRAWRAVFSDYIALLPTGGITPESMSEWVDAGATGFGIGGALFKPNKSMQEIGHSALEFVKEWTVISN